MSKVIRFQKTGGPEVLSLEDETLAAPGAGQALVRHTAIGVNYIDIYLRSGLYPTPLPAVPGNEAVGVVEAVGPGVTEVKAGDRVASIISMGNYAERRLAPAERLVKLPDGIPDEDAAAMLLKGLTVHYLVFSTFPVSRGDTVLWHAAAGGVGLIACQWLKILGVHMIGTVSTEEKAALAREHGAEHVIVYTKEDFAKRVREITGGAGVPVVYDPVGKTTWEGSLDCLKPRGMLVSFGNASGPVPPFNPLVLSQKGSLFLTRPTLGHYTATREELLARSKDLFAVVLSGKVKVAPSATYKLADAAQAHRDLESRSTTGSVILVP